MSVHTKVAIAATAACTFAVCCMTYLAVEQGTLLTYAEDLSPYAIFGYAISAVSYAIDLLTGAA